MSSISATIDTRLTPETYIGLAISLSIPLILYVVLLVVTKDMR